MDTTGYTVEYHKDDQGKGSFYIAEGSRTIAEMVIAERHGQITVFHTEVKPAYEGKGLAKQLFDAIVAHARNHNLKVMPLCTYVQAQFKRHPQDFEDIWLKR